MSLPVKEILKVGERMLKVAQIEDAKLDSQMIYCHLFQVTKSQLIMEWQRVLEDWECDNYFQLLDRRAKGEPLQYILEETEFMGLPFRVGKGALIPRRDTENLVELVLELLKTGTLKGEPIFEEKKLQKKLKAMQKGSLLDLCCGTGCIGLSIKKLGIINELWLTDISEEALKYCKKNARMLGLEKNVTIKQGDLFNPLAGMFRKKKFNIIVSNPPYIPQAEIIQLQREVRDYEPVLALEGGITGLDMYERILAEVKEYMEPDGIVFFEIGYDQARQISDLAKRAGFGNARVFQDLENRDRIVAIW